MSDNEYTKLAMLWDGATADDVHARVEFLRAQQVLTIRTEEPATTAAATLMVAVDATHAPITDNTEHAANEDDITSDCSSPLSSPPSSLHSPTPTPSPPPSSNPTSSAIEEDEDNDDVEPATPAPQLKSALKSRITTGPGKTVRFPAVVATPTERPRGWVPTANAKWEDEMFDADDDDASTTTATEDNHLETSPSAPAPSRPSKRTHDDFSADSPPSPSDDTVPRGRPAKRLHASPSRPVSHTRSHSRLTASHRYRASTPTASPRRFNNYLPAFPRPVRAVAAVCASAAWLDESDDERETRRLRKRRRYESREGEVGFDHQESGWIDWAGERVSGVETVVADEGWFDEKERERGGIWEEEEEAEVGEEEEEGEKGEKEDAPVGAPTQPVDDTRGGVLDDVDDIERFERECDEELGWDLSKELSNGANNDDSEE